MATCNLQNCVGDPGMEARREVKENIVVSGRRRIEESHECLEYNALNAIP